MENQNRKHWNEVLFPVNEYEPVEMLPEIHGCCRQLRFQMAVVHLRVVLEATIYVQTDWSILALDIRSERFHHLPQRMRHWLVLYHGRLLLVARIEQSFLYCLHHRIELMHWLSLPWRIYLVSIPPPYIMTTYLLLRRWLLLLSSSPSCRSGCKRCSRSAVSLKVTFPNEPMEPLGETPPCSYSFQFLGTRAMSFRDSSQTHCRYIFDC